MLTPRPVENGYVRVVDSHGRTVIYPAALRPPIRNDRWQIRYYAHRDGTAFVTDTPLLGGPVDLETLRWARAPSVGVRDRWHRSVRNAIPLRWVADLTEARPSLKLWVRYTSGRSEDGRVDLASLTEPVPNAPVLRQSNGDVEAIRVNVLLPSERGRRIGGYVFMSPSAEAPFKMRGVYRFYDWNHPFEVDFADFLHAYMVVKHEKQVVLAEGSRGFLTEPIGILVDIRDGKVRVHLRDQSAGDWSVHAPDVGCPVTLLENARRD